MEPTLSPCCVRFRAGDLDLIQRAATKADARVSPWIRAAVEARANDVLDGGKMKPLPAIPAGEAVRCVRFRSRLLERLHKAAKKEKLSIAAWIRAIAVAAAKP